jgi:hypothetical protein
MRLQKHSLHLDKPQKILSLLATPQNNYTLTLKEVALSCYSSLLNTFSIQEILLSVKLLELLCKHVHNNWEMSSELVVKL